MNKTILGFGMGLLLVLAGCQTVPYQGQARNVTIKPQKEGVISIAVNHRDEDRQKAQEMMTRNCQPYEVEVLEEGEVAVGTKTDSTGRDTDRASTERQVGTLFGVAVMSGEAGGKNTQSSSQTVSIKEWHISYKCDSKKAESKKAVSRR